MLFYRAALILLGVGAAVAAGMAMDSGAWATIAVGLGATVITVGQIVAEGMRRSRSDLIGELERKVKQLMEAQAKCEERLGAAYSWMQWAQANMQLKPNAVPFPLAPC